MPSFLRSSICSQAQLESDVFQNWVEKIGEARGHMHRKVWEWAFICQALHERGMLAPGKRGLAFAVGQEPLPAFFASYGCEIVATDAPPEVIAEGSWKSTNQYAETIDALNARGLCDPQKFAEHVTFRHADMNNIPSGLRDFDFVWSSCSFEHLGSIALGAKFLANMTACLKESGVAVHTTEFNLSSNEDTIDNAPDVLFRKRDIEMMVNRLRAMGNGIDVDYTLGDLEKDRVVDKPPYTHSPHLRLMIGDYVTTSIGLIVEKGSVPLKSRLLSRFKTAMGQ